MQDKTLHGEVKYYTLSPEEMESKFGTSKKKCTICGEPVRCKGLCNKHYRRRQKYGDPHYIKPREIKVHPPCSCGAPYSAKGLCERCYKREYKQKRLDQGICLACGMTNERKTHICSKCQGIARIKRRARSG